MAKIPLRARDGSVRAYAIVDDEDFDRVNDYRWSLKAGGYVGRTVWYREAGEPRRCRVLRLHNWLTGWDRVDHIDGNPLNNRRGNLRPAHQPANAQNRSTNRNSRSGVRGVIFRNGRWTARAMVNKRAHWLGSFETMDEAEAAVKVFRAAHMPYSVDR